MCPPRSTTGTVQACGSTCVFLRSVEYLREHTRRTQSEPKASGTPRRRGATALPAPLSGERSHVLASAVNKQESERHGRLIRLWRNLRHVMIRKAAAQNPMTTRTYTRLPDHTHSTWHRVDDQRHRRLQRRECVGANVKLRQGLLPIGPWQQEVPRVPLDWRLSSSFELALDHGLGRLRDGRGPGWTSYGRPHEAAKAALQRITRQVARRRGDGCAQGVRRQMRRAIGTELARRVARMSPACWPTTSPQVGVSDSVSDSDSDVD